jgi:hypothetical protein
MPVIMTLARPITRPVCPESLTGAVTPTMITKDFPLIWRKSFAK